MYGASNVTIVGNYIGLNAAGTVASANNQNGIYLENSSNITVGGLNAADMRQQVSSKLRRAERRAIIGQRPMLLARRWQSAGIANVRAQPAKPARIPSGDRRTYPPDEGLQ